jgi:hypothetical protein
LDINAGDNIILGTQSGLDNNVIITISSTSGGGSGSSGTSGSSGFNYEAWSLGYPVDEVPTYVDIKSKNDAGATYNRVRFIPGTNVSISGSNEGSKTLALTFSAASGTGGSGSSGTSGTSGTSFYSPTLWSQTLLQTGITTSYNNIMTVSTTNSGSHYFASATLGIQVASSGWTYARIITTGSTTGIRYALYHPIAGDYSFTVSGIVGTDPGENYSFYVDVRSTALSAKALTSIDGSQYASNFSVIRIN